jgi:hypothetical protein
MTADIIRQIALTGCRRAEMIALKWDEADTACSCLQLADSKEGRSIRPSGLPVVEYLENRRSGAQGEYVFPRRDGDTAFASFPNQELARVTEERDILKKPPRISPRMQGEIRVRFRASPVVQGAGDVPLSAHPTQRFLCMAENVTRGRPRNMGLFTLLIWDRLNSRTGGRHVSHMHYRCRS